MHRCAFFNWENMSSAESPLILTQEMLLDSNRSKQSKDARRSWYEAREDGDMVLAWLCGDARGIFNPDRAFILRSIAAGGSREQYINLLRYSRIRGIFVINHFEGTEDDVLDASLVESGQAPFGCGGLKAKADAIKNGSTPGNKNGIGKYVDEEIVHPDAVIQSFTMAIRTSRLTNIPVMAGLQNHVTGTVFAIAVFSEGKVMESAVSVEELFQNQYDPSKIYNRGGISSIDENRLPDVFRVAMSRNKRMLRELNEDFPGLHQDQLLQRPHSVQFGEPAKPIQLRYDIFRKPGSVFSVTTPRADLDLDDVTFAELEAGFNQLQYPLEHAVRNAGNPDLPFSSLHNLLIETRDIGRSERLVRRALREYEWMRDFSQLQNRRILIAQVNHGEAQIVRPFAA